MSNAIKRNSNIELVRIISMLLIIAHHFVAHGSCMQSINIKNILFLSVFQPGGKVGFSIFLAIAMWYMVDQSYKMERAVRMWFEALFYSGVFYIVAIIVANGRAPYENGFTIKDIICVLLPINGNVHGFVATYIVFYLFLPFIQKAMDGVTEKQTRYLLIVLFYIQIVAEIIREWAGFSRPMMGELIFFLFCYVLAFYLKRWPIRFFQTQKGTLLLFFLAIILYAVLVVLDMIVYSKINESPFMIFLVHLNSYEYGLLNVIIGFSLFLSVKSFKPVYNSFINFFSKFTLGILLIHDHNYFRAILWKYVIKTSEWYNKGLKEFAIYFILVVFSIYFICSMIDWIRINTLERWVMNFNRVKSFCKIINEAINDEKNN